MSRNSTKVILITANIASCFEQLDNLLKNYLEELFKPIEKIGCKFIAIHCQEVGGKDYESSMKNMDVFYMNIRNQAQKLGFSKSCIFLDVEYNCPEKFTALGNLYFIHKDLKHAKIWNFAEKEFVDCSDHQEFVGNIENVPVKEKSKFPQEFFPECKWSRKGFMRTRWQLNGTQFDLINIHLFHDACNFVAMENFPSKYSLNRKRAMEYTLDKFHNDCLQNVPIFIFGDFNFRLDTGAVVKELVSNCSSIETDSAGEKTKQFINKDGTCQLKISKKKFLHLNHDKIFLYQDGQWMHQFDLEPQQFSERLCELPISFPPSYPFEEDLNSALGNQYMKTRCPAWCDRVLFTKAAKRLIDMSQSENNYGMIGLHSKMGDHKPIALSFTVPNESIVNCCTPCAPCPNFVHNPVAISCFQAGDWCRCETNTHSNIVPCQENIKVMQLSNIKNLVVDPIQSENRVEDRPPEDVTEGSQMDSTSPYISLLKRNSLIKRVQSDPVVAEGWIRKKYSHLQVGHSNSLDSHITNASYKLRTTSSRLISHHSSSSEEWFDRVESQGQSSSSVYQDPNDEPIVSTFKPDSANTPIQQPCLISNEEKKSCCILS